VHILFGPKLILTILATSASSTNSAENRQEQTVRDKVNKTESHGLTRVLCFSFASRLTLTAKRCRSYKRNIVGPCDSVFFFSHRPNFFEWPKNSSSVIMSDKVGERTILRRILILLQDKWPNTTKFSYTYKRTHWEYDDWWKRNTKSNMLRCKFADAADSRFSQVLSITPKQHCMHWKNACHIWKVCTLLTFTLSVKGASSRSWPQGLLETNWNSAIFLGNLLETQNH